MQTIRKALSSAVSGPAYGAPCPDHIAIDPAPFLASIAASNQSLATARSKRTNSPSRHQLLVAVPDLSISTRCSFAARAGPRGLDALRGELIASCAAARRVLAETDGEHANDDRKRAALQRSVECGLRVAWSFHPFSRCMRRVDGYGHRHTEFGLRSVGSFGSGGKGSAGATSRVVSRWPAGH